MSIIAISGKKGAGKSIFSQYLGELMPSIAYKLFADTLKDMTCRLLGCTREQLEDREFKGAPLPDFGNKTPRQIMQWLGDDFGRQKVSEDIWVTALLGDFEHPRHRQVLLTSEGYKINEKLPNWIISDCRYPNEAEGVKARGGVVIRIERPGIYLDQHASETALDDYTDWDYVVHNDSDLEHLRGLAKTIYSEMKRKDQV